MRIALTDQAQSLMRKHVLTGDNVIDATADKGRDTLWLAELMVEGGRGFRFRQSTGGHRFSRVTAGTGRLGPPRDMVLTGGRVHDTVYSGIVTWLDKARHI